MSKKLIENIKKYKLADKYIERAKKRDRSYKFLVKGLDIEQLKKEQENPSLYRGVSRAFNYRPTRKNNERLEHVVIPAYTGNIVVTFEYAASQGESKYINIIDIKKIDNPYAKRKKDIPELTERQIRNRAVWAAEKILTNYSAESYYVNDIPLSGLELKKDLVEELSILYIQEYGVRKK